MKSKTVRYTFDTLPALTAAQEARMKKLAAQPETEIDTSDLPPASPE